MAKSIIEATKIQARAVIPIVKALEKDIGKARAHHIVGRAIADNHIPWMEKRGMGATDDPHAPDINPKYLIERQVVDNGSNSYGHNVTACAFADIFQAIGEPEIGALMCCGVDFANEARF